MSADAKASADGDGSARAEAQASALGEGEGQGSGELTHRADQPSGAAATLAAAQLAPSSVLLGARHDLKLRPGQGTASCSCLSVALGGSHGPSMLWTSAAPEIDETTQLAIALSSEGVDCKNEPKGSLGASYWGYRIAGNDVVVLVEAARGGRPQTSGAVIPRPVGPGQVYVAPAQKKLPYGRPLEGDGLCKIGNPGGTRTTPFTQLELGSDEVPTTTSVSKVKTGSDRDLPATIEVPSE